VLKNAVPNFNIIREEPIKLPFWALILTLSSKCFSSIPLYPTGRPLAQGADRVPCGGTSAIRAPRADLRSVSLRRL